MRSGAAGSAGAGAEYSALALGDGASSSSAPAVAGAEELGAITVRTAFGEPDWRPVYGHRDWTAANKNWLTCANPM